ncbi:engulfment and cell motility protein 3 isoform X1 [Stegostoma tigrinum]|uniref:engulfment and cell motility protein 3 isoform X1 n=1 Tax=Stegostoma tigrinum TaxID=3053191 RepID=UPI0028705243|nr:engulfment and cell motility protein 3 isoform X1 [Stegostoma tigrinum]XP_059507573.1 engulfment and cell motility protein 3 isoform X1 [Stegostoma tigrinum]XP_059507574.1 engulfment and cell motility protein 3 isoform X1 [Stegostoma tigrinum]
MPLPKDIVKIAVQMPGAYPQLIDLDQKKPLSTVLKEVCDVWNKSNPDQYALQYADGIQTYITETNRHDIKNGSILRLATAPSREAENLYTGTQSNNYNVRSDSLKSLAVLSKDITFAQEFISKDGIAVLVHIVENGHDTGESLAHALNAFIELMEHGVVSWETLNHVFIKKIAGFVNKSAMDASIQQLSLAILESMVLSSGFLFQLVKSEVPLDRLISHLQVTNQMIQTKAMALIIALLLSSKEDERKEMMDFLNKRNLRQYIFKNIILSSSTMRDEMAHYLYVLQSISLNLLEPRTKIPMDPYNQEQRDMVHRLRQAAFESDADGSPGNFNADRRKSLCAREFKKLGFPNSANPSLDFSRTPPGLLPLDNMTYFATHHTDAYNRFVLENSSREDKHECPFGRGSIQLTIILCDILKIGDPPSETGQDFYPMFFAQDRVFEELFCVCIQLLNKTWKEMRATQEDFDKVMQVVREQITRTLASKPTSLDLFRNKVNAMNYSEILKLRQTERMHQEETLAPPVLELRERLKPELMELIKQQRLNRLCDGTLFRKISSRRRQDKLWYCRLSPNHKVLHYGDVEERDENPAIELLQEKIPVADIKALVTGKDCPHMKEKSTLKQNREVLDLAFSVLYDAEDYSLNFIAPTKYDFCLWTDGLNVLLGKELYSEQTKSELEILLSMEVKLRLLDLENIPIPEAAPPIPNAPSNYNFCYDYSHTEH